MKFFSRWVFAASVGLALFSGTAVGATDSARVKRITLPMEKTKLLDSTLPGFAAAQTYCLTCHSSDYVRSQPPSARAYWQATVVKMQKTFGAPIPEHEIAALVDYLVGAYGATSPVAAKSASDQLPR